MENDDVVDASVETDNALGQDLEQLAEAAEGVADALARWAGAVEHQSKNVIPKTVKRVVEKSLQNWNGEQMPISRSWVEAEVDGLNGMDRDIAKLSVLGIGLRSHTGVGEKMFQALANANINIQMVNTSEIRMSVVVSDDSGEAAEKALLEVFEL